MSNKTIVVRMNPKHPGTMRRRAGFAFSKKPLAVEVNKDQEQAIRNDEWLLLVEKGLAKKDALKKKADKDKKEDQVDGEVNNTDPSDEDNQPLTPDDGVINDQNDDEVATPNFDKMNKAELVEALEKNGMKKGEDFDALANNADLKNLLLENL